MALLPIRHPQRDFFVLDIADVVPKDDTASMEHPLFSLATKPDMRELHYQSGENSLTVIPSGNGLPTIFDKDILIFCISQLMHRKNQGKPIGKTVRFSGRELMIATNRPTGGEAYKRLEQAFIRLRGTTFKTDIRTGKKVEKRIFGMIDEGGFVMKEDFSRLDYCEVVLSDWVMRAIEAAEVVTISENYFRIGRPLERRLYEIARKHCGRSPRFQIGLEKLQAKTGSNAPIKRFRHNLRQIIEEDHTPDYTFTLTEDDLVIVKPRRERPRFTPKIALPEWAEDEAREICLEKRLDYQAVQAEWQAFAAKTPPDNAGRAFVGFCKKKKGGQ